MKFVYKGCTYRTENLTDERKKLMSKEIETAKKKAERLKIVKKVVSDTNEKIKSQKAK
jgi:hypothetical protein